MLFDVHRNIVVSSALWESVHQLCSGFSTKIHHTRAYIYVHAFTTIRSIKLKSMLLKRHTKSMKYLIESFKTFIHCVILNSVIELCFLLIVSFRWHQMKNRKEDSNCFVWNNKLNVWSVCGFPKEEDEEHEKVQKHFAVNRQFENTIQPENPPLHFIAHKITVFYIIECQTITIFIFRHMWNSVCFVRTLPIIKSMFYQHHKWIDRYVTREYTAYGFSNMQIRLPVECKYLHLFIFNRTA